MTLVRHQEDGFQLSKQAVCPPFFREINGCLRDIPLCLLQHPLEPFQEGHCIGGSTCESGKNPAFMEPADF